MNKSRLLGAVCAVLFSLITVSTNAALVGRLPITPGGTDYQAAYDTVLDITWVTDGDLSVRRTWSEQVDWAANLDYLGFDDWRLASMSVRAGLPTGSSTGITFACMMYPSPSNELACRDNEMGYMYYYTMGGNLSGPYDDDRSGNQTVNGVLLTNIQGPTRYWSGTDDPVPDQHFGDHFAWVFGFSEGLQTRMQDGPRVQNTGYGWAVRDGDVQENPDADGDGVNDDEDLCPETALEAAVDAVGCSDAQVDGDGDGVCNDGAVSNGPSTCVGDDACPGTVIPEAVPTVKLGTNRWALVDDDFEFNTTAPKGKGPGRSYSTADTDGCSCGQIIAALELGKGHTKHGCSIGAMDGWVALPR